MKIEQVFDDGELLHNANFSQPATPGRTEFVGKGAGNSAAQSWTTWASFEARIETELVPTTLPGRTGTMLKISTQGSAGLVGIDQTNFRQPPVSIGPTQAWVWVFVEEGQIGMGVADPGNAGIGVKNTKIGEWELLHTRCLLTERSIKSSFTPQRRNQPIMLAALPFGPSTGCDNFQSGRSTTTIIGPAPT